MRERLELYEMPEHDDEVAQLIREGISQAVSREDERLVGLELRVVHALERRQARRASGVRAWVERVLPALRPRPAWALATAAALALFALGFWLGSQTAEPFVGEPQGVEFVVFQPTAKEVSLAISYPVNGRPEWQDIPMKKRDGFWYISLQLPPGTYEYGFKIDGQWWAYDPAADYLVLSADNTVNAVREIRVGPGDQS